MPEQGKQFPLRDAMRAQRAVVLQLLRDDRTERWTRAELERELGDLPLLTIDRAVVSLAENGVVRTSGQSLCASVCTRYIDTLGLIAI